MREARRSSVRKVSGMWKFGLSLAALCCLAVAGPGLAQQAGSDGITADHKDIGKVQARILKHDQALGVVVQLARPRSTSVECNGVCYLPAGSKPVAWKCEPDRKCDLHCTVNPPVAAATGAGQLLHDIAEGGRRNGEIE